MKNTTDINEKFDKFFEILMLLEGGFVNNKNDQGGKTKYGITEKTLAVYNERKGLKLRIESLTRNDAKNIYRELFFDTVKPTSPDVCYYHYFDLCVNSGYDDYRQCWIETESDIRKVIKWRKDKFISEVKRKESQGDFFKGWLNRLNRINAMFDISVT